MHDKLIKCTIKENHIFQESKKKPNLHFTKAYISS
jgi:hypothetical protein